MKILIIGFAKIKYMPYLNLYLDNLDFSKNDVHIVYWNRDLKEEDLSQLSPCCLHEFKFFQEDDVKKHKKINGFLKFRRFLKCVLAQEFDFIIVLQSVPAVLCADCLKKYKGKYILDYRDKTYENIPLYRKAVNKLSKESYKTFISSDGFRDVFSCKDKLITTHNIIKSDLSEVTATFKKTQKEKIKIGFWGLIRNESVNLQIIKQIAKDGRFTLNYYGREQAVAKKLKEYVAENNIENVFFEGEYDSSCKNDIVLKTDIIHNINDNEAAKPSVSNKYYDGLIFKKPQLCMEGTYMGALVEKNGTGLSVNPFDADFTDKIYGYYSALGGNEFAENCSKQLGNIIKENSIAEELLKNI